MSEVILVTGGLGYIGSHFVSVLEKYKNVIIIDDLSNSLLSTFQILKKSSSLNLVFIECDIRKFNDLNYVFTKYKIDHVAHFAAKKDISESFEQKKLYYDVNVIGTKNILSLANKYGVKKFIFSSTAAVYKVSNYPLNENSPIELNSPYAQSKYDCEKIIQNNSLTNKNMQCFSLRYFNPMGAYSELHIGENFVNQNNLMSMILKSINDKNLPFKVYGNDYLTRDGSCERDFIHILDLVNFHKVLLSSNLKFHYEVFNIGNGKGISVFDVIKEFEKVNKLKINFSIAPRRKFDIMISITDISKAKKLFNWKNTYTLSQMCKSSYEYSKRRSLII